ncbi:PREDICTED: uncharacterized protein LOC109591345 [Amphimedon queenslandica]|uniref:LRAT domain-containing protein n=1 Tax=Amphimedon queenslandica TaxID=400682 RepID=A0A1X7SUZ4_AMPQE|nr:PREDICTED: uncharacterized protein LOC109591345 [Amphimedon queenslandica]|eukprot:XP_019862653.1 PREDICTED: uncharacterized protein LOC109591345 [Amphimedon queenslandica]
MVLKYKATRITSLGSLKPGDHIRVSHMLYNHHMLVVKVINNGLLLHVIHYSESEYRQASVGAATSAALPSSFSLSNGTDIAKVKEENIFVDPQEDRVELLEYDDPEVAVHRGRNAIRRACSRIGENRYDFVFTNCESLINWAITGREETGQGQVAIVAGAAAAAAVGVAGLAAVAVATIGIPGLVLSGLAFAYGYRRGNEEQRDDDEDN